MAHTKGNWKVGRPGTVVSDRMDELQLPKGSGYSDTDYYGGYLIAESIAREHDAKLMAAAPDLLEALIMVNDADNDNKLDGASGIPPLAKAKIVNAIKKATE